MLIYITPLPVVASTAVIRSRAFVIASADIDYILSGRFIHSSSFLAFREGPRSLTDNSGASDLSFAGSNQLALFHHDLNHIPVEGGIVGREYPVECIQFGYKLIRFDLMLVSQVCRASGGRSP